MKNRQQLREHAIARTLFAPTTLKAALQRMGFVQADPIRAPARAQDLILRHRVRGYRAGDLERRYAQLALEEDLLYAYGFLPRSFARLLHPRPTTPIPQLEKKVLELVHRCGPLHPNELAAHFGRKRVVNAWGGYSQATKRALERLHHRGLLRIARRDNGIRIYQSAPPPDARLAPAERLRTLILLVAAILAPSLDGTLQSIAARLRRKIPGAPGHRALLADLFRSGELEKQTVDGLAYVWPPAPRLPAAALDRVRLLAPFDPLVWDRRRFEHLWGWSYRFEAYTPPPRRMRGYYALPLLWRDRMIGWANLAVVANRLQVETGFVEKCGDADFRAALDDELARMAWFLGVSAP